MLGILMDYFMGGDSPYKPYDPFKARHYIGSKRGLGLNYFMDIMAQTIATVETRGMKASGTRPPTCKAEDKDKQLAWPPMKCIHFLNNEVILSLSLSLLNNTTHKTPHYTMRNTY